MNRAELQRLAEARLLDAHALLGAGRWSAAYYLAGYSVECALKSCVLHYVEKTGMIFKERRYLKSLADCWTHELDSLVQLGRLGWRIGNCLQCESGVGGFWGVAKEWKETSRYEEKTQLDAEQLYEAISHEPHGVLRWIRSHW